MASKHYTVIDKGMKRIKNDLRLLNGSYTKVGFPENAKPGGATKIVKGKKIKTSMSEIALIAAYNNWGTMIRVTKKMAGWFAWKGFHVKVGTVIKVPQREFMASSFDESLARLIQNRNKLYGMVIDNTLSVHKSLAILGEFMVASTKKKIRALRTPPNHPITVAMKGSDNPLINSGQMINSVTHIEVIR